MNGTGSHGGEPLDEAACETLLRRRGYGVLSLARDGRAYGVPISFGYVDRCAYFVFFGFGDHGSRKVEMVGHTTSASLLAVEVAGADDWWSVLARGEIRLVETREEWERLATAMHANAWRPDLLDPEFESNGVEGYAMEVATLGGRRGSATRLDEVATD